MTDSYRYIKEIKTYAEEENIPIMVDEGIKYLTDLITKNNINNVLEIGTAIGYSAIMMALANPNLKVTSIERDEARYLQAVKNIKKLNLENRITLIFKDALDVKVENSKYDLIFIDAAKGKNKEFFELFSKHLTDEGLIVTDNINFHGFTAMEDSSIKSKNMRSLIRKIREYIDFLKENEEYMTEFNDIGDGIAVTRKIEK